MEKGQSDFGDQVERVRTLSHDAKDLAAEVQEAAGEVTKVVQSEVQAHPYRTLLGAAFVGYVLGGGLASPLTGQLVRVGMRLLVIPMVRTQLFGEATGAVAPVEMQH